MRVAYLVSRYPAISHTFVLREVTALRRLGVDVRTFSIRRAAPRDLLAEADREADRSTYAILPPRWQEVVRAHLAALLAGPAAYFATLRLAIGQSPGGLRNTLWQFFYFMEAIIFWRACRLHRVQHVHAHFANVASDVAMLAGSFASSAGDGSRTWSFTMHGPRGFEDVTLHRLPQKVESANRVVCISNYARSQLMALVGREHWAKMSVVRCGIDTDVFTDVNPGRRAHPSFEILTVGRLVPVKGQALLIEAVAELKRLGIDARATIVGDGPERDALARLVDGLGIADRVRLTGAVGQDEIRSYYAAADVFCLPSFAEGVPVVLMEAMAMGLPVVTTRITGVPELVEDGVSGLLVTASRLDELTDALRQVAQDPEMASEMGLAGRRKVAADFDIDVSARQLRDLFTRLADSNGEGL